MESVDIILVLIGVVLISLILVLLTVENRMYFDVMVGVASISGFLLAVYDFVRIHRRK